MVRIPRVAMALCIPAVLAACEAAPVDEVTGAPIELSESAIEILGGSDSLVVARDLEIASDGSIWILNSTEPLFVGFGPDGEALGSHGQSGRGPRDFPMPAGFVAGGWQGEVWALDLMRHAMIQVSRPDADWVEISLRSASLFPGTVRGGRSMLGGSVRTARLGREFIVPRTSATMEGGVLNFRFSLMRPDLVAFDPETGETRTLVALTDVLEDPSSTFDPIEGGFGFPLWYRLWASCGENAIRIYDRVTNQLRGFDGSGAELAPIILPPVPFTEVTARQFAGAIFAIRQAELTGDVWSRLSPEDSVRVMNQMVRSVQGRPHELASYLPRYVDFRCSQDGMMWLNPVDLNAGGLKGATMWLRIAPDGVIREVRLPERFDALRFSDSRVWGVYRDELDVPSVASIALPAR